MSDEISPAIPTSLGGRQIMSADALDGALRTIDLDAMLQQLSGRLDPGGRQRFASDQAAARAQIAALAARLLAEPLYRPLVEWLYDITLRRPVSIWGLGAEALAYVERREGANAVVWQLLQAAAEGRGEQPEPREGQI